MSTLAEWVIQMSAAGQEATLGKMQEVQRGLDALEDSAKGVGAAMEIAGKKAGGWDDLRKAAEETKKAFDQGKTGAKEAKDALALIEATAEMRERQAEDRKRAEKRRQEEMLAAQKRREQETVRGNQAIAGTYNLLAGTVLSYVRAGLQGTAEGEVIGLRFQQISREVANLFVPAIHAGIDALTAVVGWFRSLDGRQQENLGRWAALGVSALFVAQAMPKVAAGIEMVGVALKAALAGNPVGLILVATAALVGLLGNTEKGRAALEKLGAVAVNTLGPVLERLAGVLEDVADKLAEAADALGPVVDQLGTLGGTAGGGRGHGLGNILGAATGAPLAALGVDPLAPLVAATGLPLARLFGDPQNAEARRSRGPRDRQELTPRGGGFESVTETFRRLQTAANRTDIPQRQLDTQRNILTFMQTAFSAARSQPARPAVGE